MAARTPRALCTLFRLQNQIQRTSRVVTLTATQPRIYQRSLSQKWGDYELSRQQPVAMYRRYSSTVESSVPKNKPTVKKVNITFIDRDGDEHTVQAKVGDSLLEVAKDYDIDLEGACEGTLSCSTCHLIVDGDWYDKIPDPLTEEEQDMLDLALGITDMSRLGCQILVSEALEGLKLTVPTVTKDIRNT